MDIITKFLKNSFQLQNVFYVASGAAIARFFTFVFESYIVLDLKVVFELNDFLIGLIYTIISLMNLFVILRSNKISDNLTTKYGKRKPMIIFGALGCIISLSFLTYLVYAKALVLFIVFIFIGMFFRSTFIHIGPTFISEITPKSYAPIGYSILAFFEDMIIVIFLFILNLIHSGDLKTIHFPVGFIMVMIMLVCLAIFMVTVNENKFSLIKKQGTPKTKYGKIVKDNINKILNNTTKTLKSHNLNKKTFIPIIVATLLTFMAIDVYRTYSSRYIHFHLHESIQFINKIFIIETIIFCVITFPLGFIIKKIGNKNSYIFGSLLLFLTAISQFLFKLHGNKEIISIVALSISFIFLTISSFSFMIISASKNTRSLVSSIYFIVISLATIFNQTISSLIFVLEKKMFNSNYSFLPLYISVLAFFTLLALLFSETDKKLKFMSNLRKNIKLLIEQKETQRKI